VLGTRGSGLAFERQAPLPVLYEEVRRDIGYRIDVVVDGRLVVELKAVDKLMPLHQAQLRTYLRPGGI
jgi:GxxExxY protein